MKICGSCKRNLPFDSFARNKTKKDGLQTICKDCKKNYNQEYYADTKDRYREQRAESRKQLRKVAQALVIDYLKSHPCVDCGESNLIVLEFDHRSDKKHHVSNLIASGAGKDKLMAEINKCDVRCSNCHKIKTARDFGWYRSVDIVENVVLD